VASKNPQFVVCVVATDNVGQSINSNSIYTT
jgi:hypothetical protein